MIKVQTPVLLNERETEREKKYHGPEENNIYKTNNFTFVI
jgi:hypothetical protein